MSRITVFTPTYNRANTLERVYTSLYNQTYRDFEWYIIDDGSTDNTKEVIDSFKRTANFKIEYYYQRNAGKHIAINNAVKMCNSEFFIIADSDDSFKDEALMIFITEWENIPLEIRYKYKGIICKCYDILTGEDIGDFGADKVDATELDAGFKLDFGFEKWSFFRTQVLKEFPFPEPEEKLKFFPETVVWQNMSRKYLTRYINVALRAYYKDQDNALTSKTNLRYRENKYLWLHYINNVSDYAKYDPILFIKAYIGVSRDKLLCGYSYKDIITRINKKKSKVLVTLFYPVAVIFKNIYLIEHKEIKLDSK